MLAAAEHGGNIYAFGGCGSPCFAPPLHTSTFEETRVEVYEPGPDRWTALRPMPSIVFGAAAAGPGDGKIYLFGGYVTAGSTQAYDPPETWSTKAAMPTPRHGLAAVAVDGKIYLIGGSNGTAAVAALEAYHPASDSWEPLASMPTARVFLAAAALGRKIYAIGGAPDCCGNGATAAVEIYDIDSNEWTTGPPLPKAMQTSAAAARDGKIYVLGGFVPGEGTTGATFEYDPRSGWTTKTSMPVSKDQAPAVALADGIHVLGGSTHCHCTALADHHSYDPEVSPVADLRIVKTDEPAQACPGETVTYEITVTNGGPAAVRGAHVTDTFHPSLTGTTWSCTPSSPADATCGATGTVSAAGIDDRVDLRPGASVVYTVRGTIALGASGTLLSTAGVSPPAGVADPNSGNDTSKGDGVIVRRDRLEIVKTMVPSRGLICPQDRLQYEIDVTNRCRIRLPTTIEDDLSTAGLTDPRWCRGAGCDPSTPGSLQETVTLPAGGRAAFTVSGLVPCSPTTPPPLHNVASATAPGQKPATSAVDTPRGDDRLEVAIAGPGVLDGCSGDYAITIRNRGSCTAANVVLAVPEPDGLHLVSLSPLCTAESPCAIAPSVPVTVTARFEAEVGLQCPLAPVSIAATARSLCSQPPKPPAQAAVTAAIPCDLSIAKTDDLAQAAPGDCTTYSINVTNNGCGAVAGATVKDLFPDALETVSWCRGGPCVPTKAGDLEDVLSLAPRDSETYHVAATISPDFVGALKNSASVTLPPMIADVKPADNAATDVTVVEPRPGVDAQCTGTESQVAEGSEVTFAFVLWNGGPAPQGDNPGDELAYVLPAGLTLVSAVASSGIITIGPANTVHWNGAIPVDGKVTIDVTVTVDLGTVGMSFCSAPVVMSDPDGDGINDAVAPTDDRCHPCCFGVTEVPPIPTLSQLAIAGLALLLAALALARLLGRAS